jgi:hypothetical protein
MQDGAIQLVYPQDTLACKVHPDSICCHTTTAVICTGNACPLSVTDITYSSTQVKVCLSPKFMQVTNSG